MQKDIKLADSVIYEQKHIISYKDSLLSNANSKINIEKSNNEICNIELNTAKAENKKANRKVKFFKFTSISVAILGLTTTVYALFH